MQDIRSEKLVKGCAAIIRLDAVSSVAANTYKTIFFCLNIVFP
jgi:hypothetical protein